jgi:ribosomal protein S16
MTLDPLVSFAARQPLSDGHITQNTNLAIATLPLATPLAFVGAARFLRGQRCASRLVNLYLPLPQQMTITATPCLPLLAGTALPAQQALAARWLSPTAPSAGVVWCALAFHTLQTQGASQSITRDTGTLDYAWLATLQQRVGDEVGAYWRFALHQSREALPYELDTLTDCLLHRSGTAWQQHLNELAHIFAQQSDARMRRYTDFEVKEITAMLAARETLPLRVVLAQEQGTRRFGRTLRQLGRYNPSALREYVEELDAVRDLDQLLRLLAQITQTCEVLKAKSEFIIVPTDDDLDILLADVDQFGVKRIASVLLILAVLRYPREEREEPADSPGQAETETDVYEEMTP